MENILNQLFKALVIIAAVIGLAYGAYQLYNIAIDDATNKIRAGVSEGVQEGAGKAMNPLGMVKGIFGGGNR